MCIRDSFDSERYREYLKVMSKFHNYSFRNTVLIAMQKPDASLLAGFSAWKNNFERNVMRGEKGIKIIAPSPYKIKQEMQKIDPHTQKPIIGKDGKPVTEEKEVDVYKRQGGLPRQAPLSLSPLSHRSFSRRARLCTTA